MSLGVPTIEKTAGIQRQLVSRVQHGQRKAPLGRQPNGGLIASGTPVKHGGRIAGGAPEIVNPQMHSVFAPRVFLSPLPLGNAPGGLIDKKQQIDPRITNYAHPFSGHKYRSISSQMILPPLTTWNGFVVAQEHTPSVQPHERGTFFAHRLTPAVKTQFGTNQTGRRPDTAFHRNPKFVFPRAHMISTPPTEKLVRAVTPVSFISHNTLRADPLNSQYQKGGRWGQIKRSASQP